MSSSTPKQRRIGRDMAALRRRDPGFLCSYCSTPLALPLAQASLEHERWEDDGWELREFDDGDAVWQMKEGHQPAQRDHVEPSSKGGKDHIDNLVLACATCNNRKKARPLLLFLAHMAGVPRFRSADQDSFAAFTRVWQAA